MKIGIDIDDTTFFTIESMLKYADIFEEKRTGKIIKRDKIGRVKDSYYLEAIYGWKVETTMAFFDKYYKNALEDCTMLEGANKVINKLRANGNEIHFVTARINNIANCDSEFITKNSLKENGIEYDTLNLHINDKVSFFKENGIQLCIEDSYETCRKMKDNGIDAILMTTVMNCDIDNKDITRVHNWNEIEKILL